MAYLLFGYTLCGVDILRLDVDIACSTFCGALSWAQWEIILAESDMWMRCCFGRRCHAAGNDDCQTHDGLEGAVGVGNNKTYERRSAGQLYVFLAEPEEVCERHDSDLIKHAFVASYLI